VVVEYIGTYKYTLGSTFCPYHYNSGHFHPENIKEYKYCKRFLKKSVGVILLLLIKIKIKNIMYLPLL